MSTNGKIKRKVGRPRSVVPWASSAKFYVNINYKESKIAHTFAMLNQSDLNERIIQAIELLVEKEKDQNLLDDEKRNSIVFSLINEDKRPRKEKTTTKRQDFSQITLTPNSQPKVDHQTHKNEPKAQYSDIVSNGGFDPRNKFDEQINGTISHAPPASSPLRAGPAIEPASSPLRAGPAIEPASSPLRVKQEIEFGSDEMPAAAEQVAPSIKSRFLKNHNY